MAKILILDIETAPNVVYVWRFFKENIGPKQVIENSYIMSFAAKWLGEDEMTYYDAFVSGEEFMLQRLWEMLDQADIVVAHNGDKFDIPRVKARCLVLGMPPMSPFKSVDTCSVAKRQFKFESNSLEHLANILGCQPKLAHKNFPGFELWVECLRKNPLAWKELKVYNEQDVTTLEEVYLKMRPWINNHPNVGVYEEEEDHVCPKCGGKHHQRRGFSYTNIGKYQRFRCNDCGGWFRTRHTEYPKDIRKALVVHAVN